MEGAQKMFISSSCVFIEVLLDTGWRRAPNLKCLLPGYCRIAQASCEVKRPGVEVTLLGRKEDSH